jgi:hypothetical protein
VASVFTQRRPPEEVIVVDDGSTDATAQALAVFGDRLRCLHQEHRGPSAARNLGVRMASGDVIAFIDSDDRWLPGHLSTLVDALARSPEAVLASTCPGLRFGAPLSSREPTLVAPMPRLMIGNFVGYPSCTAVRREAIVAAEGFREEFEASEAYELWLRLGSLGPFSLVRQRTVIRARPPDSLSRRAVRDGSMLAAREQIGERLTAEGGVLPPALNRATLSYRGFIGALRAFDQGDTERASKALADSCLLMPERSDEPWLIGGWLGLLPRSCAPRGRLAAFVWAAHAWPERAADTALGLRLHASFLALRSGRVRLAARLLRDSPRKAMLRFVLRLALSMTTRFERASHEDAKWTTKGAAPSSPRALRSRCTRPRAFRR